MITTRLVDPPPMSQIDHFYLWIQFLDLVSYQRPVAGFSKFFDAKEHNILLVERLEPGKQLLHIELRENLFYIRGLEGFT